LKCKPIAVNKYLFFYFQDHSKALGHIYEYYINNCLDVSNPHSTHNLCKGLVLYKLDLGRTRLGKFFSFIMKYFSTRKNLKLFES